jgi:hypothetical protein
MNQTFQKTIGMLFSSIRSKTRMPRPAQQTGVGEVFNSKPYQHSGGAFFGRKTQVLNHPSDATPEDLESVSLIQQSALLGALATRRGVGCEPRLDESMQAIRPRAERRGLLTECVMAWRKAWNDFKDIGVQS